MSNHELFVAQLDWSVEEHELTELFMQYGQVISARIPTDKMTGKKRGFAFVAMETGDQAQAAIHGLNAQEFRGRQLVVKMAEPKPARPQGGGYGGGNRGGGYGGQRQGYGAY